MKHSNPLLLMLALSIFVAASATAESKLLCAKKSLTNTKPVKLARALKVVDGTDCPAGFAAVTDSATFTDISDITAGGSLNGTYPNPSIADGAILTDHLATFPGVQVNRSSAQVIANGGSGDFITFTGEAFDTSGMFNPGDNFVTIIVPGTYLITANLAWTSSGVGVRNITLLENALVLAQDTRTSVNGSEIQSLTRVVRLVANETISLRAFQNSGGNLATSAMPNIGHVLMSVQWIAP